jgi:hypothetical protein
MQGYADLVVRGQVSADDQAKVREAHGRYQAALKAAVTAAELDLSGRTPQELGQFASDLTTLILSITRKPPIPPTQ